jgi:hypothetical protein
MTPRGPKENWGLRESNVTTDDVLEHMARLVTEQVQQGTND